MAQLPRLIALSPGDLGPADRARFLAALERAFAAGLPGLLLREPRLSEREFLGLGKAVLGLRARYPGVWFAVHDRAHLAVELCADGVHLSFRSLRPAELRAWLAPGIALGLSTHAEDDPRTWGGADYLFHGPLHATPSKAGRVAPVGFEGLARAVCVASAPVFALGGVTPSDLARLRGLGVYGAAVQSGLLGASDAGSATRAYLEALA